VNTVFRGIIRSYKFCSEQGKLNDCLLSSDLRLRLTQSWWVIHLKKTKCW